MKEARALHVAAPVPDVDGAVPHVEIADDEDAHRRRNLRADLIGSRGTHKHGDKESGNNKRPEEILLFHIQYYPTCHPIFNDLYGEKN